MMKLKARDSLPVQFYDHVQATIQEAKANLKVHSLHPSLFFALSSELTSQVKCSVELTEGEVHTAGGCKVEVYHGDARGLARKVQRRPYCKRSHTL